MTFHHSVSSVSSLSASTGLWVWKPPVPLLREDVRWDRPLVSKRWIWSLGRGRGAGPWKLLYFLPVGLLRAQTACQTLFLWLLFMYLFLKFYLFILAALGLHGCTRASPSWGERGLHSRFGAGELLTASGSLPMSQLFASDGQSIGVSASASVLPMNTQDWSPLGWTGWISLQSKGLSRVFSNTTIQKH